MSIVSKIFDVLWQIIYNINMIQIRRSWYELLKDEFDKDYFKKLQAFLQDEYSRYQIYPAEQNIFNALNHVPYDKIKVVIIGQDPYHEPGQAQGLSFSVPENVQIPPSLVNIMKEIEDDLHIKCYPNGNLERWANQGVLLLNTVLTVRRGQANSHKDKGWEILTRKIIELVGSKNGSGYEDLQNTWPHRPPFLKKIDCPAPQPAAVSQVGHCGFFV